MTISTRVRQQFLAPEQQDQLIRIPQTKCHIASVLATTSSSNCSSTHHQNSNGLWSAMEHERFLQALELFPHGPWKYIAAYIGNKTARQAMCHAQKYRQKIARRKRSHQVDQRGGKSKSSEADTLSGPTKPPRQDQMPSQETEGNQEGRNQPILSSAKPSEANPATQRLIVTSCPSSPSEVSSPTTDELIELDWTTLPNTQEFQSCSQYHQTHHQVFVGPFDPLVQHHHHHQPIASNSFSGLLLQEDHEVLLSTVNEFLDSLEVTQVDFHF